MLKRHAFSLFELLVVIVIIGVVYGLGVGMIQVPKNTKNTLTIETISTYMHEKYAGEEVHLRVYEDGESVLWVNGAKKEALEPLFKNTDLRVYQETPARFEPLEYTAVLDEKNKKRDVLFKYSINKDNKGSQVLVELSSRVYLFRGYAYTPLSFSTLSEARGYIEQLTGQIDAL